MLFSAHYKLPLFIALFALNLLMSPLFAADISVQIDRNPVNLNESFQITFSANEKPDGEPDFTPLEKDFEILSSPLLRNLTLNSNGKFTRSIEWVLTVTAKRTGNIIVPVINFGKDSTPYSVILVNPSKTDITSNKDIFLKVNVSNNKPFTQEQVIYTLQIYYKVKIYQPELTKLDIGNAILEQLGKEKTYQAEYQGNSYKVIELKYAIFPQKSGDLIIPALSLSANVLTSNQQPQFNGFFNRQNTRTQRVSSESITLDVQAKPTEAADNYWLPAEQVYLEEKWSADIAHIKVGEPITRTLSLLIKGATQGALPELYADNIPANLKAYPDQPTLKETAKDDSIIAYREEKIALIPGIAGTYLLPAIEIPWWNTATKKMEVARIAEQTMTAVAVTSTNNAGTPTLKVEPETSTPVIINNNPTVTTISSDESPWFWLAIFFAGAWLVTLIYFLSRNRKKSQKGAGSTAHEKAGTIDKTLKKACKSNEPAQTKEALIEWGREQFNQSSLTKIAEQCAPALQDEILALNGILYGGENKEWQGEALWTAFKRNQPLTTKQTTEAETLPPFLPPLFKIQ